MFANVTKSTRQTEDGPVYVVAVAVSVTSEERELLERFGAPYWDVLLDYVGIDDDSPVDTPFAREFTDVEDALSFIDRVDTALANTIGYIRTAQRFNGTLKLGEPLA